MIYHHNRITLRPGVSEADRQAALDSLRNQGQVIDAVKHFVVGRDIGGEYEWGAVFALEDLDGYWEYLMHPAHRRTDEIGLPLVDQFVSYDTTDDLDPQMPDKIAELHRRRYAQDPGLRELVMGLGDYTGSAAPQHDDHKP